MPAPQDIPCRSAQKVSVPYSSVELATEDGAANLYRKLKQAARSVCDVYGVKLLRAAPPLALKCYEKSSSEQAVYQVDAQRVTALHTAATRGLG